MNVVSKERESGIELLRILAAMGVVYSHYCNEGGILSDDLGEASYCILTLIRSLTISSVDVFVLITGYFMCTSYKRTIRKPLDLLIQVSLFSSTIYLLLIFLGVESFSVKDLLRCIVPANWFVSLYIVLYLISPYINTVFCKMTKKDWEVFLIIIISLFSLSPTLLGIIESLGVKLTALSTIGLGGNAAGYTLVNFFTLYCIGAYIRFFNISEWVSLKKASITIILCVILLWLIRYLFRSIQHRGTLQVGTIIF